ncbi:MAG: hypothetical protein ABI634_10525 [Acidobacteriota bacterium]
MISRVIVITLAFIVAAVQASRGAWMESAGLVGLGTGLLMLRVWGAQPRRRWLAWVAFSVTAVAMVVVALRMRG